MFDQIHFANQYLAAAGKSFLEHRTDDSHTNIGFDINTKSFQTWNLNSKGLKLLFDLPNFQLKWSLGESWKLNGKIHASTLQWLKSTSKQKGLEKPYSFELHYDLPFGWNEDFAFELSDKSRLTKEIELRTLANTALNTFLNVENLKSDVRVWPHHFDTGAFVTLENGSGKSIGMGMAIPDTIVNEHYFYMSGYQGNESINTSDFSVLEVGEWKNEGFKGAVLPVSSKNEKQAVSFLRQAFAQYLD